ncbi:hypothetical protein ACT4R9_07985 [Ornithobacterium rhinotracheale]|uniref:hypothetical protein n=1 Tax=Ornithobacterium rhinotracheale TaxID=28251 RepID=UPI003FA4B8A8
MKIKKLLAYCVAIALLSVANTSCKNDDDEKIEIPAELVGTWELTEKYFPSGMPDDWKWKKVQNDEKYTLTLNADHSFTSTQFPNCQKGTYNHWENKLSLNYLCERSEENIYIFKFKDKNYSLILSPTYLNCDEGCSYKFVRVR